MPSNSSIGMIAMRTVPYHLVIQPFLVSLPFLSPLDCNFILPDAAYIMNIMNDGQSHGQARLRRNPTLRGVEI